MPTAGATALSNIDPLGLQLRNNEADTRYSLGGLSMPKPGSTVSYRSGVYASGPVNGVTRATAKHSGLLATASGMVMTVLPGQCQIDTPSNGPYFCTLDTAKTLTLAASHATQNRYDLIIARVYDDRNSAIASPANTRKFQIEVIQGDNAGGSPTKPYAFLPANGWIPLFEVLINGGATTPTSITDVRGPGLVARGGMRTLTGSDATPGSAAFVEAGAYPGEQRWVHSAAFPHQAYYSGSADPLQGGWQGVFNCLRYYGSAPSGIHFAAGFGATLDIATLVIPDPGVPYFIYPTGKAALTISEQSAVHLRLNIGTSSGADINWESAENTFERGYGDYENSTCVSPIHYGPLTGSTTIVMSASMRVSDSAFSLVQYNGNNVGHNHISCLVFPAIPTAP